MANVEFPVKPFVKVFKLPSLRNFVVRNLHVWDPAAEVVRIVLSSAIRFCLLVGFEARLVHRKCVDSLIRLPLVSDFVLN